jgi:hypothetical protein
MLDKKLGKVPFKLLFFKLKTANNWRELTQFGNRPPNKLWSSMRVCKLVRFEISWGTLPYRKLELIFRISRHDSLAIFAGKEPHKPSEVRERTFRSGNLVRVVMNESIEKVFGRAGENGFPVIWSWVTLFE